jgi:putative phage-type endonuclease
MIDDAILSNIEYLHSKNIEGFSKYIYNSLNNEFTLPSILERVKSIYEYRIILETLKKLPFVKQRTEEWLELRKNRLTASDLYDAIKGGLTSMNLAKKKANIINDTINYNAIPALKWGTMFEPMASRCYSQANNNMNVYDFGLICDPNNEHFGASPDGINELGIMIEIKCPYSRKIIDDVIPIKYKMQMQGQLAVCGLKECDYIECEFKTLENEEEYLQSIAKYAKVNHGIIAEYLNQDNSYDYLYSAANNTPLEAIEDIHKQMDKDDINNIKKYKMHYWVLVKMNVQKVYFDENEWKSIVPKISAFWDKVEEYKNMPEASVTFAESTKTKEKIQFIDD